MQNYPHTDRFVRRSGIKAITGVSATTAYRLEKQGIFPKRRQLSPGLVGWLESELLEWVRTRSFPSIEAPNKGNGRRKKGAAGSEHRDSAADHQKPEGKSLPSRQLSTPVDHRGGPQSGLSRKSEH